MYSGSYRYIYPKNDKDILGIFHRFSKLKINATSSTPYKSNPLYGPQHAINYSSTSYFHSINEGTNWLIVNFPQNNIFITNYSIQTYHYNYGGSHLRQWIAEGLDKSGNWIKIDEESESNLNSSYAIQTKCTTISGPFQSFRITNTGKTYWNNDVLVVQNIDFFGVVDIRSCLTRCRSRKPFIDYLLFAVFISTRS